MKSFKQYPIETLLCPYMMGDMNAKVGCDNTGLERVMGQQGAKCKMNENGELLTDYCAANELVIGSTLFPHKECHKVTWVSPDRKTQNQIDHIAIAIDGKVHYKM